MPITKDEKLDYVSFGIPSTGSTLSPGVYFVTQGILCHMEHQLVSIMTCDGNDRNQLMMMIETTITWLHQLMLQMTKKTPGDKIDPVDGMWFFDESKAL